MIGAIAGDVIGSVHEAAGTKSRDFELFGLYHRFTDDTVLTVAVAEWLLKQGDLVDLLHGYFHCHPDAGFGGQFFKWAARRVREPYNSWGNGSAMRVSPVGFAAQSLDEALDLATRSAQVTHNHPEGIRGAQATAGAIFLARTGNTQDHIAEWVASAIGYDESTPLAEIRASYAFDVSCQGSVPQSIRAFLEAETYEDAVRNAISLGGDADTMACIAGGIAEAFWGVPPEIVAETRVRLPDSLLTVVDEFRTRFLG